MAMKMKSNENSRISDLYDEPVGRLLAPIRGYEDKPLLSLMETLEPISELFHDIGDYAFVALNNCENPSDDLTQQESASIYLYTMQFHDGPSLFLSLNQSLRAENRQDLKPWFSFLKLFLTALYKLPSESKTVWRGIRNVDLSEKYKTGTKFAWWGVSSCAINIEVLESNEFLGKTGERTIFSIECINGKSIENHSYFKNIEKEIILMPGSYFQVIGQLNPAPQLHIIQLKEIIPPIPFIKPPFIKSININSSSSSIVNQSTLNIIEQNQSLDVVSKPISLKTTTQKLFIPNLNINQKWKKNGTTQAGGHGEGSRLNQLSHPYDVYIDDDDDQTIYVTDTWNHRIVKWKNGATNNGQIVAGGNGNGNRNDQLNYPTSMIVDKENDSLIICDADNRRIVRWPRQNGRHGEIIISNIDCWDLIMDNDGYFYVSDLKKHEVRRWKIGETNETIVAGGNGSGNHHDQLCEPYYIFVDQDCSVYVSDYNNHRVMKWLKNAKKGIVVAGGHSKGNSLRQLSNPQGIIVDQLGSVYVADYGNDRVVRWLKGAHEGTIVVGGNARGEQPNQLSWPVDLSFDQQNNLYIVDRGNHRVQKFDVNLN